MGMTKLNMIIMETLCQTGDMHNQYKKNIVSIDT